MAENPDVLPEYTDAHLSEGAGREDEYGRRCRALLKLPATARQEVDAAAYRATHHTPTVRVQTRSGPMASSGATAVVGDYAAEVEAGVERWLSTAEDAVVEMHGGAGWECSACQGASGLAYDNSRDARRALDRHKASEHADSAPVTETSR